MSWLRPVSKLCKKKCALLSQVSFRLLAASLRWRSLADTSLQLTVGATLEQASAQQLQAVTDFLATIEYLDAASVIAGDYSLQFTADFAEQPVFDNNYVVAGTLSTRLYELFAVAGNDAAQCRTNPSRRSFP